MKPRVTERQTKDQNQGIERFIQKRAYELYLSRGQSPGHEMDDWLQAELEIKAQRRPESLKA